MTITIQAALKKGIEAHKTGRLSEAKNFYSIILSKLPNHPDANHNMGVLAVGTGKIHDSIPFFKSALEANSMNVQYWISYIDTLIKAKRVPDAINILYQAKTYGIEEKFLKRFKNIVEKFNSDSSTVYKNQNPVQNQLKPIIELLNGNEFGKALALAQKLINQFPDSTLLYNIQGAANAGLQKFTLAIKCYQRAIDIQPNFAEAYNNMGNAFQEMGRATDSINSYHKAANIKPNQVEFHYNLGNALKTHGELGLSKKCFEKVLELNPNFLEAKHLLCSLKGETTLEAPDEYVSGLFNQFAYKFDRVLVTELNYNMPQFISDIILKNCSKNSLGSVLDLGCGTGLVGSKIKKHCINLEGIDLSHAMLKQAKEKKIYNNLKKSSIKNFLSKEKLNFDYFIFADVFIYVGELSEVFRLIKSRNTKPGRLVFSTEHIEKIGYKLEVSGRYSHSQSYIEELCKKFNYKMIHFEKILLRQEKEGSITGGLYLLDF